MVSKASQKTIIYLVRHGESVSNKEGIISGHSDYDLTEQGRDQVRETKEALRHVSFDEVYSSDLKRAMQTAEILYGRPVSETNRIHTLRERDFGSLDGGPQSSYMKMSSRRHDMPHAEGWVYKHVPDYENDEELSARFLSALEKIAGANPGKTILVAAHGSAIRVTMMKIEGFTYKDLPAGSFGNAAYAEVWYEPGKEPGSRFKVIQINGVKL
jgi:probable phosphoglycerate mutase/uncharacterized phosphatase